MKVKKWLWIMAMVIMVTPLAFASSITVDILESQDEVEAGSTAEFTLKITNDGIERDVFSIEPDEFNVYPFSEFAKKIEAIPYQVKLDAEESALVKVRIKTIATVTPNKN